MQEISRNKNKLLKKLGDIVKKHRKQNKKTIYAISAEISMSKSTWREVELGVNDIKLTTLWKISEGLDISIDEIIKELTVEMGENFSLTDII